jgi:hypothetical protein
VGWDEKNWGEGKYEVGKIRSGRPAERESERKQVQRAESEETARGWANALDETCSCTGGGLIAFSKRIKDARRGTRLCHIGLRLSDALGRLGAEWS